MRIVSEKLILFFGIVLPPLLFFGWMIFTPYTIGNDYRVYQVSEMMRYRLFHKLSVEPMWDSFQTGGIPFHGHPFTQIFHFPAWVISHLPGYWSGNMLLLITTKHILLAMMAHAVTFAIARRLTKLPHIVCYLISFISLYNLRTLDALRYGGSFDTFVYGQCLILLGFLFFYTGKRILLIPAIVLSQFVITSGYYPLLPHLSLGAILAFLLILYFDPPQFGIKLAAHRIAYLAVAVIAGIGLSAPNWIPFTEYLEVNETRGEANLWWTNLYPLTPSGLFLNLVKPWSADVHSAFGGTTLLPLLMVAIIVVGLLDFKRTVMVLVILAVPFLLAFGAESSLYVFFFRHVPGFGMIRMPGRIMIILPFILLALCFWFKNRPYESIRRFIVPAVFISSALNILLILIVMVKVIFPDPAWLSEIMNRYSPETLHSAFWTGSAPIYWLTMGLLASFGFVGLLRYPKLSIAVLLSATIIQTSMVITHGTWMEKREPTRTFAELSKSDFLPAYLHLSTDPGGNASSGTASLPFERIIGSARNNVNCYYPVNKDQKDIGVTIPFYLSDHFICLGSDDEIFQTMRHEKSCSNNSVIHTYRIDSSCGREKTSVENSSLAKLNRNNHLLSLTPNLIRMRFDTKQDSVLVTSFPFVTRNWSAEIEGHTWPLLRVNGGFVGVMVPAGRHTVKISYFSELTILSYRVFFGSLCCTVFFLFFLYRKELPFVFIVVLALSTIIGCLIGAFLYNSHFSKMARRELLLPNNYQNLLAEQLNRWSSR